MAAAQVTGLQVVVDNIDRSQLGEFSEDEQDAFDRHIEQALGPLAATTASLGCSDEQILRYACENADRLNTRTNESVGQLILVLGIPCSEMDSPIEVTFPEPSATSD